MARRSKKQEEMFSLIAGWQASGESQQVYCKKVGLAYSAFHYWLKRYKYINKEQNDTGNNFLPIKITTHSQTRPVACLIFPDGRCLNFYVTPEASFLKELLC